MSEAGSLDWCEMNQRHLAAALGEVRSLLERACGDTGQPHGESPGTQAPAADAGPTGAAASDEFGEPPLALELLCQTFGLSPFERGILLLCAGIELDGAFPALCAKAQGDPRSSHVTFALGLAVVPDAHWSALSPDAPLRHWRLVELAPGDDLVRGALRIDERVLHFLTGVQHLDEKLRAYMEPVRGTTDLAPPHEAVAERAAAILACERHPGDVLPVVQICGGDAATQRSVAIAACRKLGLYLYTIDARAIPLDPRELEGLIRLWEREAALAASALLLECGRSNPAEEDREHAILQFVARTRGPLLLAVGTPRAVPHRIGVTCELRPLPASAQRPLWTRELGTHAEDAKEIVDRLVAHFNLGLPAIRAACVETLGGRRDARGSGSGDPSDLAAALWNACRRQARPRLEGLARRVEPAASLEDLVLPSVQRRVLEDVLIQVRQRIRVYERWGFGRRTSRGLGVSALFAGPSGTGKTMAAEALAKELRLDLFRIDLSSVVSKYIGETERNLRRVFDAAEQGAAILLFDEADALFGKRSEVKDSHDRYANIEISYLLQRMEWYSGLAILTTNLKSALDNAFLRRIRFVVQFPFPDAPQREEIWRRVFPLETPTEGLNFAKLARLSVTGGSILNIALGAAFLAAEAGEPVRMTHLLRAARTELLKLEKPLSEAEVKGWVD